MIYGSVCSGIEAATAAWHPLNWRPAFFAEIDKFPSTVLAHHYPKVPNLGDFTKITPDQHVAIDLLVGGTPCQSFSIAGLRGGMADARGNLALEFLRLAQRTRARWLVWENVPGVLSSNGGRDFGAILGGMVELGYGVAYRVLDAQYVRVDGFGRAVPQRRRRVFVVGYLGDWRRAAAVLFERACLLGDSAPRREAGERVAGTFSAGAHPGCYNRQDATNNMLVAHSLKADGFDASEDGTSRGTLLIPIDMRQASRGETITNNRSEGSTGGAPGSGIGDDGDPAFTVTDRVQAIAFDSKASGRNGFGIVDGGRVSATLRSMSHSNSHQNAGGHVAIAFAQNSRDEVRMFGDDGQTVGALAAEPGIKQQTYVATIQERAICENPAADPDGVGVRDDGASFTLEARTVPQAVATSWAVRRLTPKECERLQGFPDGYTDVPWRNKNWTPDGPRYKALGNSMAVNCMRWIGRRIELVETGR